MSSRQYVPRMRESESRRQPFSDADADESAGRGIFASRLRARSAFAAEQLSALGFLGLARAFEWQAAAFHVALAECTRQQREWLGSLAEMESALQHFGLSRAHIERMLDVARLWGAWTVTTQLATAQGLASSCSPQRIGLPADSGRRAGFDLGRRAGTVGGVVIGFPDRRRSGERR